MHGVEGGKQGRGGILASGISKEILAWVKVADGGRLLEAPGAQDKSAGATPGVLPDLWHRTGRRKARWRAAPLRWSGRKHGPRNLPAIRQRHHGLDDSAGLYGGEA